MNRIVTLCTLLLLISACTSTSTSHSQAIKVGVLADKTGNLASLLRGVHRGVRIAADRFEERTGRQVQLIVEDQKSCNTKVTASAMNKLTSIDNVDFVIGGTCSSTTLTAAPIANRTQTVLISPSSSAPSISAMGPYVFRTYISDTQRAKAAARLAYKLGYENAALITEVTNDATVQLSEAITKTFEDLGGSVLTEQTIRKSDTDFRTQLTKIKQQNPGVVFLSVTSPKQVGMIAQQAKTLGLQTQFISPFQTVENEDTIQTGGNAVNGLIYVVPGEPPNTSRYQAFRKEYGKKYNESTVPPYTTEAYDAFMLGAKAVVRAENQRELRDTLYNVSEEYNGLSGNVTFDARGDVHKPVRFKRIRNGSFIKYKPNVTVR